MSGFGAPPHKGYSFSVYSTIAQTLTASASTKIEFNGEEFDDDGVFDLANNKFVAPVDGKYFFEGNLHTETMGVGKELRARIYVNGALAKDGFISYLTSASFIPCSAVSGTVNLSKGDYVELYGYISSGSNKDTIPSQFRIRFSGHKVAS